VNVVHKTTGTLKTFLIFTKTVSPVSVSAVSVTSVEVSVPRHSSQDIPVIKVKMC